MAGLSAANALPPDGWPFWGGLHVPALYASYRAGMTMRPSFDDAKGELLQMVKLPCLG